MNLRFLTLKTHFIEPSKKKFFCLHLWLLRRSWHLSICEIIAWLFYAHCRYVSWLQKQNSMIMEIQDGFSASKCDVGNWMFLKLGIFWEIFWKSFGFFLDFWEEFFWRIVWEDFFGMDFLGGIFWEEFFVYIASVKPAKLFESERDWCFCQDFVSMEKEGGAQCL
mgnify:CR=1 FL=1